MISDKALIRLSMVVSIVGLAALFAVLQLVQPFEIEIGEIDQSMVGRNVVVNGIVDSVSIKDGHVFMDLTDSTGTINIVMFERNARNIGYAVREGMNLSVSGKVSIFRNEIEIVADSIKTL